MIDREFEVSEGVTVKVRLGPGGLTVKAGQPDIIRVVVDTNDKNFTVDQRGDTVIVGGDRGGRRAKWATAIVHVPSGTDLDVATSSATITAKQDLGRLEIATASGDVRFDDCARLQAKTASGSVRGDRVESEARVMSASGNIRIAEIAERGNISTASGDVTIDEVAGPLAVTTVSGDIKVGRLTGSELQAKSMSGRIRLGIPRGTRVDLDANTHSGNVKLPKPDPNPMPAERDVAVTAKLVSGDLKIVRVD